MSFGFSTYTSTFFSDGTALISTSLPLEGSRHNCCLSGSDPHILEKVSTANERILIVRTSSEVVVFHYRGKRTSNSREQTKLSNARVLDFYRVQDNWYFSFEDGDLVICSEYEYRIVRRQLLA